jgi:hypothetical protein
VWPIDVIAAAAKTQDGKFAVQFLVNRLARIDK